ncbi:hypothetical protein KAJ61_03985 [Candidatus Parcubacteria bacterium]|nr:hypothetical protein [Candidatus Parcubacteria bacterium]
MENKKDIFLKKFNPKKYGFESLHPFEDCPLGFSVKKRLHESNENNITLLSVYIPDRVYNDEKVNKKKPIFIRATYGKISDNGVTIRDFENTNPRDPVDTESLNDYFYNIETKEFFKKNKTINPDDIINEIYNKHIKSTKLIRGIMIRFKIFLWRKIISKLLKIISNFFYYLLLVVSGNRYVYEPILGEETINTKVVKSKFDEVDLEMKEVLKEGEKFKFLDYEASRWSIIFYSLLHFSIFIVFYIYDLQPEIITIVIKNNFLTLLYVILSLWILETVIPSILMSLIRFFSTQSANSLYKTIKL